MLRDHPVIENMERTGYPDGNEPVEVCCPVCGRVCDEVYCNEDDEVVGCSECLISRSPYEILM